MNLPPPSISTNKRPHSNSTSSRSQPSNEIDEDVNSPTEAPKTKDSSKIRKKIRPTDKSKVSYNEVSTQLKSVNDLITNNPESFPLNLNQITEFLTNCYGQTNILEIAEKYTQDLTSLKSMLQEINGQLLDKNLKSRISRIMRRLEGTHFNDNRSISSFSEAEEE